MQRIKLGKPYEEFIKSQIEAGYYGTATEVIRDALRDKMEQCENDRIAQIHALVAEGRKDWEEGRVVAYSQELMSEIGKEAKKRLENDVPILRHVRPD